MLSTRCICADSAATLGRIFDTFNAEEFRVGAAAVLLLGLLLVTLLLLPVTLLFMLQLLH
jgi:hypothetical protein